ncbi:MAG TPA: sterol desaturase family protein [Candidatus Methylomirabilis sp.]|nr:sterol desaturase family protein [Candidatus Methylomirabilis sp.]
MVAPSTAKESTRFGSGWISGVLSVFLGALGLGGVLCLLFPGELTTPQVRDALPVPVARALIHVVLVAGFGLGFLSALLRRRKILGLSGAALATVATLLGGWKVPLPDSVHSSHYLGLDWFLLNLLLMALIFVPIESLFARLKDQGIFRPAWRTDLAHFFVSHLLVQVSVFLTLMPAQVFFGWAVSQRLQQAVAGQPYLLQFLAIVLVADLSEYWIHRAFHRVPLLWRFHAVHHSAEYMDWLAGSRLHLVDIVVTRGLTFVPLFVLGFAKPPIFAYLVFVSFHAVFIHANVNFRFGWLRALIVTPQFHHWHHSAAPEAVDKNFAVHLPWLDRLFGTHLLPGDRWPAQYGIAGHPVPDGYLHQLLYPLHG